MLRQNTRKPELVLIDFEYCSYNYRAFDIANHFVEWQYDYTATEYPFFHERAGSGPTREQKVSVRLLHLSKYTIRKERITVRSSRFLILPSLVQLVLRRPYQVEHNYYDYSIPSDFAAISKRS